LYEIWSQKSEWLSKKIKKLKYKIKNAIEEIQEKALVKCYFKRNLVKTNSIKVL